MDSEQRSRNQIGTPKTNRRDPKSAEKKKANEDRKIIDRKICHFSVNDFSVFSRSPVAKKFGSSRSSSISGRNFGPQMRYSTMPVAYSRMVEVVHCRVSEI